MSSSQTSRGERLRRMQERFFEELPVRLDELEAAWSQVLEAEDRPGALETFHRLMHGLAGTAGTLGQPTIGRHAREIECLAASLFQAERPVRGELVERIGTLVKTLGLCSAQALPEIGKAAKEDIRPCPDSRQTEAEDASPPCLLLIEEDPQLAEELVAQLGYYGWDVAWCAHGAPADIERALERRRPRAIVSDATLAAGLPGTAPSPSARRADAQVPVIAVSERWDWDSRLAAVRSGADACLAKPIETHRLADLLDGLTRERPRDPYRVLILDDSVLLGGYYAALLRDAGMHAAAISEPRTLLDSLNALDPELILMDLYMPGCSGAEAARVIRQDERYAGVPIVFLSSESDRQQQLTAMGTGADDFLTKPIGDADLVSAVALRIARFRSLTALIRQDSLTGLLNRIAFDLQVETETTRACRSGSPLVLAMLDIDHFKRINDTYGHPVGDRVIKSLAQMLRKRLRRYDVIGRYGGEEFSVLMPDTRLDAAAQVLNALRGQFALLRLTTPGGHVQCTFSAGLAALGDHPGQGLTAAADAALYEAKRLGRNRIRCAVKDASGTASQVEPSASSVPEDGQARPR